MIYYPESNDHPITSLIPLYQDECFCYGELRKPSREDFGFSPPGLISEQSAIHEFICKTQESQLLGSGYAYQCSTIEVDSFRQSPIHPLDSSSSSTTKSLSGPKRGGGPVKVSFGLWYISCGQALSSSSLLMKPPGLTSNILYDLTSDV